LGAVNVPHAWQAVAASGSGIGINGSALAASAMALTGAELYRSPETIAAVKVERDN